MARLQKPLVLLCGRKHNSDRGDTMTDFDESNPFPNSVSREQVTHDRQLLVLDRSTYKWCASINVTGSIIYGPVYVMYVQDRHGLRYRLDHLGIAPFYDWDKKKFVWLERFVTFADTPLMRYDVIRLAVQYLGALSRDHYNHLLTFKLS
jgi:hypothetical protein